MLETALRLGGGHWSLLLGSLPFDSINLAGNGYTIRQIQGQVHKALAYSPDVVVIMAGTNDLLGDQYNEHKAVKELVSISRMFAQSSSLCVITLPVKMRKISASQAVQRLNDQLRVTLSGSDCTLLDLNPVLAPQGVLSDRFSADGVHLTHEAYAVWVDHLRPVLP